MVLWAGIDFNVEPYIPAAVGITIGEDIYLVDEIIIPTGNTPLLIKEMRERFGSRLQTVYPDPAGRARHTNAPVGQSDHELLRQAGFNVLSHPRTLSVKDTVTAVNTRLRNACGDKHLFVSKKCRQTIEGFRRFPIKSGTSIPDDSNYYSHIMSGIRYAVDFQFPVRKTGTWGQG